ncbi:probable receptor-like protein kinase At5g38990 [Lactuca sativa]|uniref:probable receptor-like protein kinase At5g38990 n=1 Tax=Lactuca sativa TaxID=4236 RepID=UPI001C693137|nr:probable receptor-like protein kinase At5g38990 [Lactuca sativa]
MKILTAIQTRHPYSFGDQNVLPLVMDFCLNKMTNPEQEIISFDWFLIHCMSMAKIVLECKEYKPIMTGCVVNEKVVTLEQRKKNISGAVAGIYTEGTKISLHDIKLATNNFSKDRCIGEGGFAKVYIGELVHSEGYIMTVAVKRLNLTNEVGNRGFKNERNLSRYRNGNIVNLLGYYNDDNEEILVYEYVAKRSLDFYINNNDLRWVQRPKICIGAASGLVYLHNPEAYHESVWHLDIKSGNILLDENWNAKVTDFGLSKFIVANQESTSPIYVVVGTRVL